MSQKFKYWYTSLEGESLLSSDSGIQTPSVIYGSAIFDTWLMSFHYSYIKRTKVERSWRILWEMLF